MSRPNPWRLARRAAAKTAARAILLSPSKTQALLGKWYRHGERTAFESFVFDDFFRQWTQRIYLREKDPDKREALKTIAMGGVGGVNWAAEYAASGIDRDRTHGSLPFDEGFPWFPAMERLLGDAPPGTKVVQIGSSSGAEMDHFAAMFPAAEFVGTDIDEAIISRSRSHYKRDNLRFDIALAHEIARVVDDHSPLIVFSSGSMQFVQPEHLMKFMGWLASRPATSLVLGEPWADGGAPIFSFPSRWRANFSYSHDYGTYARNAGLTPEVDRLIEFDPNPGSEHFGKRHYFLQIKPRQFPTAAVAPYKASFGAGRAENTRLESK